MKKIAIAVMLVLCGTACSTSLTSAARAVQTASRVPHGNCEGLGTVYGSGSGGGWTSTESKLRNAENELLNRAAERGGNLVVMKTSSSDVLGIALSGNVYQCGAAPVPERPTRVKRKTRKAPKASSREQRLEELQSLHSKGLITQEDYDSSRAEILKGI